MLTYKDTLSISISTSRRQCYYGLDSRICWFYYNLCVLVLSEARRECCRNLLYASSISFCVRFVRWKSDRNIRRRFKVQEISWENFKIRDFKEIFRSSSYQKTTNSSRMRLLFREISYGLEIRGLLFGLKCSGTNSRTKEI